MKGIVFLASIATSASLMATLPTITANSVTMTQDQSSHLVTISYTLADAPAIVTVDIQTNGVSIGADKFQYVAGAVNMKVQPGTHQITWQPAVEWPSAPQRLIASGVKAVVKAWACDDPPPYLVVDLAVSHAYRFYPCVEAIPGGLTNDVTYKMDKMVMRRIPAKNVTWRMGSPSNEPGSQWFSRDATEIPHYVRLTKDYYMGVFEVTQKQLSHFILNGSNFVSSGPTTKGDTLPMTFLTICDIRGWDTRGNDGKIGNANTMSEDLDEAYANSPIGILRTLTGLNFNLPTDAQWEYACRAGTSTGLNNGHEANSWSDAYDIAWCDRSIATAMNIVGTKQPNNWGLYDMHGNVEEVCLDRYTEGADFTATFGENYQSGDVVVDPRVGGGVDNGSPRVIRGGEWHADSVARLRSAGRKTSREADAVRSYNRGFRLVCPVEIP